MKRYSLTYIERPKNISDSKRAKIRIASYYRDNIHKQNCKLQHSFDGTFGELITQTIEKEIGIPIEVDYFPYLTDYKVEKSLLNVEVTDFLDILCIISSTIQLSISRISLEQWVVFIERVFREECMPYCIDNDGIIHPYIDEEFTYNNESTLIALSNGKYGHIREIYKNAYKSLRSDKQDTRTAVKDIFECIETLAKLMDSSIKRLTSNEISKLNKILESTISDKDELDFCKLMFASFSKWIDAHHIYRHGQKKEDYSPPSIEAAVLSLSTGSSYLRFLIEIDKKSNK